MAVQTSICNSQFLYEFVPGALPQIRI